MSARSVGCFVSMRGNVSAEANGASVFYKGRASTYSLRNILPMEDSDWRGRLREKISGSGQSMRSISLRAGFAPGYVHSILVDEKEPSVESLTKVSQAIGVSPVYIICGMDISERELELVRRLRQQEGAEELLLAILRTRGDG